MNKKGKDLAISIIIVLILIVITMVFSYFYYEKYKVKKNMPETVLVDYLDGNELIIDPAKNIVEVEKSLTITPKKNIENEINYAVYGEIIETKDKKKFDDNLIKLSVKSDNIEGFREILNNYSNEVSLKDINNKILLYEGSIYNAKANIPFNININLKLDTSRILVSSSTKRENNIEGNPSVIDLSPDNITVLRYNDEGNMQETILYPGNKEDDGKIVFTTNEYDLYGYTLKISVEQK